MFGIDVICRLIGLIMILWLFSIWLIVMVVCRLLVCISSSGIWFWLLVCVGVCLIRLLRLYNG